MLFRLTDRNPGRFRPVVIRLTIVLVNLNIAYLSVQFFTPVIVCHCRFTGVR